MNTLQTKTNTKTKTKTKIPSLLQTTLRALPHYKPYYEQQEQQYYGPVIREGLKKMGRVKAQQLSQKKKQLQTSLRGEDVSSWFVREMHRGLSLYLKKQPDIPLDILSNIYMLFEQRLLTTERLQNFKGSSLKFSVMDNHISGREDIALLLKFQKRIYLVLLDGKYRDYYNCLTEQESQYEDPHVGPLDILNECVAIGAKRLPDDAHRIMLAIPLQPTRPNTRTLPYQQKSDKTLSALLYQKK